jgi:phospholipid-translocating P-type ATPase (flippase)
MKDNKIAYQGSSTDEIALILGAKNFGYTFKEKRSDTNSLIIEGPNGTNAEYKIKFACPFNSVRKRSSVIIKDEVLNTIWLYTKGSDDQMLSKVILNGNEKLTVEKHLNLLASLGLRTLVYGKRKISEEELKKIEDAAKECESSGNQDLIESKLEELYVSIENNLEYTGVSAIEDKLQDDVPATMQKLHLANIKIWVLTGDKMQTALAIGKSSHLITKDMENYMFDLKNVSDSDKMLDEIIKDRKINVNLPAWKKGDMISKDKYSLVVPGDVLSYIFSDKERTNKFLSVAMKAATVICCRTAPKNKSDVIKVIKSHYNMSTLAVGDGANDVPMIMEAHVGIGIRGKEGSQAINASDLAIGQFKNLQPALLVHGRLIYMRISFLLYYWFFKHIILIFAEIVFAYLNAFSGQKYFAEFLYLPYVLMWGTVDCFVGTRYDKDVSIANSLRYPQLYIAGQRNRYFNYKRFLYWILPCLWEGFVSFVLVIMALEGPMNGSGRIMGHWERSTLGLIMIVHSMAYKLYMEKRSWYMKDM